MPTPQFCLIGNTPCSHLPNEGTQTYNFECRSYENAQRSLPGNFAVDIGCDLRCLEIQSNVRIVSEFISNRFIQLNSYVASINVVHHQDFRNWENAGWLSKKKQVVFGQRYDNGNFISYGNDITIVAHEFCHGIIQKIRQGRDEEDERNQNRVQISTFQGMSNNNDIYYIEELDIEKLALEESLCDIFAILVCNYISSSGNWQSFEQWQWCVGQLRCLNEIANIDSVNSYHELSVVHSNAFYLFMNTNLFDGQFALNLLGAALENLKSDSDFSDSRKVFENSAQTLLRENPSRIQKLQAISDAFDQVGII